MTLHALLSRLGAAKLEPYVSTVDGSLRWHRRGATGRVHLPIELRDGAKEHEAALRARAPRDYKPRRKR